MLKNFVAETCNNPSNALEIVLLGAVTGGASFAAFGHNGRAFYAITDGVQREWGIGTVLVVAAQPVRLARTTVLANSAGTTQRLNFSGLCQVYNEVPAEYLPVLGLDGLLSNKLVSNIRTDYGTYTSDGFGIDATEVDFVGLDIPAGTRRIVCGCDLSAYHTGSTIIGVASSMILRQGSTETGRRVLGAVRVGNAAGAAHHAAAASGTSLLFNGPLPAGYRLTFAAKGSVAGVFAQLRTMTAWMICQLEA
jgi:hypothetical protein